MVQYLQILLNARFAKMEERGASAVEYGLLVALIAGVIIAVVAALGTALSGKFSDVTSQL
ncbi:Flp family type IVb pilin [Nocardioides montaniterrae]